MYLLVNSCLVGLVGVMDFIKDMMLVVFNVFCECGLCIMMLMGDNLIIVCLVVG